MRYREPVRLLGCPALVFASVLGATLAMATSSRAFERQWHAGVDAGYAQLNRKGSWPGMGAGAHMAYGLNDAFNLLFEADWSYHPGAHTHLTSAALGAAYTIDVTRLVPYVGVLLGGYRAFGDLPGTGLGGQVALGADYGITRDWAVGLQVRWHWVPIVDQGDTFTHLTAMLRAEYVWGF